MTDWEAMVWAIGQGDLTDACIAAALDKHQEEFGSTLAKATVEVGRLVAAKTDAQEIAAATAILNEQTPRGRRARAAVLTYTGIRSALQVRWAIIAGESEPEAVMNHLGEFAARGPRYTIVLGARWILELDADLEQVALAPAG